MSLSAQNAKLRDLEEKLQRLRTCSNQLSDHQYDFFSSRHLAAEPELTSNTWYGELSNEFTRIRENDIQPAHEEIHMSQFRDVFQVLDQKIQQIMTEINHVKAAIASLEAEERREALLSEKTR
ncbi:DUF5082 family protein [Metabacillus indicus]|uniref:YwqH-like family protein n=1 Tax=Metabacillus indicus TaxID=246786 RepID=UPI00049348CE|nr:DUF5082 family protein [Metabacillus indicus]KEZ52452.1 hypothetical protein AZ46_0201325 [Metabacillus indicus LMG 22858]